MDNRTYTIALSIVFALIALVTCTIVLVVLLVVMRQEPMVAFPAPSIPPPPTLAPTPDVRLPLEPGLVVRSAAPTAGPLPLPTQQAFLVTPALVLPTVPIVVSTSAPRPTRPQAAPTRAGPSPTPTSSFAFLLDGEVRPDPKKACTGSAIYGYFHDVDGKPVAGMRVKIYNQYLSDFSAPSKPADAPDAGYYDFIINPKPSLWNVVVVDGGNSPISPEVQVIRPTGQDVCYFQVDWKATR